MKLSWPAAPRTARPFKRHRGRLRRASVAIAVAIATVAAVACSNQTTTEFEYLRIQVDGQPTLAISKIGMMIRGIVVYFHGVDQDEFSVSSDPPHKVMTKSLVDAGFAVVSSKAGGNAFSDASTVHHYRELGSMAMQHYGIEDIYFLAESWGAIPAFNLLAGDYTPVRGIAAINPVVNIGSAEAAWPALAEQSSDRSPAVINPMDLPPALLQGKNIKFYASKDDSVVRPSDNAGAFQDRFDSVAKISVVQCSGPHGDGSCFQGDNLTRWFTQLIARP